MRNMECIEIYSGENVISKVLVGGDVGGVEAVLESYPQVFVVMDREVAMECPAAVSLAEIMNRRSVPGMLVEASEENKSLETVMEICSWLLEQGADRDALVLAVGGGITSDMVGFAASIYKRGVKFAYVPTTLLAMVDAAIGGKTGVNLQTYKNILGVIRQPEFTYISAQVLESLPHRDFLSGASEMLKTFLIQDDGNYAEAVSVLSAMNRRCCELMVEGIDEAEAWKECVSDSTKDLTRLICAAARVKAGVVSRDQFENGERRKLNLGHTFAHAIESLALKYENDITHGEAVAMGILLAAELSEKLTVRRREYDAAFIYHKLEDDFFACGLPISNPFRVQDMATAMKKDKKAEGGKVHFVLPSFIGDVRVVDLTVDDVVDTLESSL
jgi:3-dehydroquinate synthetase